MLWMFQKVPANAEAPRDKRLLFKQEIHYACEPLNTHKLFSYSGYAIIYKSDATGKYWSTGQHHTFGPPPLSVVSCPKVLHNICKYWTENQHKVDDWQMVLLCAQNSHFCGVREKRLVGNFTSSYFLRRLIPRFEPVTCRFGGWHWPLYQGLTSNFFLKTLEIKNRGKTYPLKANLKAIIRKTAKSHISNTIQPQQVSS